MPRASYLSASAVLLASSAVMALPGAASADVPTCQGKPATIVGPTSGGDTTGTAGDDVIVTTADGYRGAGVIDAGEGNDVLCIVPGDGMIPHWNVDSTFYVAMGAGNDTVVVQETRNTSSLRVTLGDGDDTFLGSSRWETVFAGNSGPSYPNMAGDFGRDHIDAGLGSDTIYSGSPSPDIANDDTIISGEGGDSLYIGGKGAVLDNGGTPGDGTGDNLAILHEGWQQRRVTVDNVARTATADVGEFMRWSNVKHFHLLVDSPLTFTGSDAAESLAVSTTIPVEHRWWVTVDATMGAGDDRARFHTGPMTGSVDGGTGTDAFEAPHCSQVNYRLNVSFDCVARSVDGGSFPFTTKVSGFDARSVVYAGYQATVSGTDGDDEIVVRAPRVRITGRDGNDVLTVSPHGKTRQSVLLGGNGRDTLTGGKRGDRLNGGAGRDILLGVRGNDRLVGGPGRDLARGGQGIDWCSAEKTRSCELPLT